MHFFWFVYWSSSESGTLGVCVECYVCPPLSLPLVNLCSLSLHFKLRQEGSLVNVCRTAVFGSLGGACKSDRADTLEAECLHLCSSVCQITWKKTIISVSNVYWSCKKGWFSPWCSNMWKNSLPVCGIKKIDLEADHRNVCFFFVRHRYDIPWQL